MRFCLHIINVTGPLDVTTPACVVDRGLRAHGFEPRVGDMALCRYRAKCIGRIEKAPPVVVDLEPSSACHPRDRVLAERFVGVGPGVLSPGELIVRLQQYESRGGCLPDETDAAMLYAACRSRGLVTDPEMTVERMRRALFLVDLGKDPLRNLVVEMVERMESVEIVNRLFDLIPPGFGFTAREFYGLYGARRIRNPLATQFPLTPYEMILTAAVTFKVDISESLSPSLEFRTLLRYGMDDDRFPVDAHLRQRLDDDPNAISLRQRFNPDLPPYVYDPRDLEVLAREEGWVDKGNEEGGEEGADKPYAYEFLRSVYYSETFFAYGRGPMSGVVPCNARLTLTHDPVLEEMRENLVLWGSRARKCGVVATTWAELADTFLSFREFRNPLVERVTCFSPFAIRKLRILARKPCIDRVCAAARARLIVAIEQTLLHQRSREEIVDRVRLLTDDTRARFSLLMDHLVEVTRAMRSLAPGETPREGYMGTMTEGDTERMVVERMVLLRTALDESPPDLRELFEGLPLVLYYPTDGRFVVAGTGFEGHTIGGRLTIVFHGNTTTAISSCIRLSSNWFMSTVYHYQTLLGVEPSFDISSFRHVS